MPDAGSEELRWAKKELRYCFAEVLDGCALTIALSEQKPAPASPRRAVTLKDALLRYRTLAKCCPNRTGISDRRAVSLASDHAAE
eukprot:scaffold136713_cov25-Prasinocladus_malaysianus.AAC.1